MKKMIFKNSVAAAARSAAMETENHVKHGISSKSLMSRGNFLSMLSFCLLSVFVIFYGCDNDDNDENVLPPEEEEEMVTVSMKAVGELTYSEATLVRNNEGSAKPLWGIQVYIALDKEPEREFEYQEATKVAHGVFDDISKVTLTLNKNRKHSIEVTYMPNGQNEIHYYGPSNDYWEVPFNTIDWTNTPMNQVIYSPSDYIYGLGGGMNTPAGDENYRVRSVYNEMDRYYGFVAEYTPIEGGTIEIDMKRTVFGLTFVGAKVDGFTYDQIMITLNADHLMVDGRKLYTLNVDNSQSTSQLVIPFICILDVRKSALEPTYVETLKVSVGIENNRSMFFYGDVNIKRNTMHTYTFNMEPPSVANSSVKAIFSDGEMANETMELID